jgi:hypothetical protein
MSASKLSLGLLVRFGCYLVVALLPGFVPTGNGAGMSDRVNTRKQACICVHYNVVQLEWSAAAVCRLF